MASFDHASNAHRAIYARPWFEDLQAFAIPNVVAFEAGKDGSPKVVLTHKNGSRAEVYLFGACVTSWWGHADHCVHLRCGANSPGTPCQAREEDTVSVYNSTMKRTGTPC